MIAAQGLNDATATAPSWLSRVAARFAALRVFLLRPCVAVAGSVAFIATGWYLWYLNSERADAGWLLSMILGARAKSGPQGRLPLPSEIGLSKPSLAEALSSTVGHDLWVILSAFLIMIAFAWLFTALVSFTESQNRVRNFILAAAFVAAAAHLVEDGIINYWVLDPPGFWPFSRFTYSFWIDATAAMAAVKFAALAIGLAAIAVTIYLLSRTASANVRASHYRKNHNGKNWWDAALVAPAETPPESATDPEAAWRQAYSVPDAQQVIDDGDDSQLHPTALCLSGGGIRSACVAMGAMQTFAEPRSNHADACNGAPELDSFDWIISVSGGGYSAGARVLGVQDHAPTDIHAGRAIAKLSERFEPGSVEFDFMRRRSSYIASTPFGLLRAGTEMMKNLLVSAVAVYWSAIIFGLLLGFFAAKGPVATVLPRKTSIPPYPNSTTPQADSASLNAHPTVAFAAIAVPITVAIFFFGIGQAFRWASSGPHSLAVQSRCMQLGRGAAWLAAPLLVLTVIGPSLMWLCQLLPLNGPTGALVGVIAVMGMQYAVTLLMLTTGGKRSGGQSRWLKFLPAGVVRITLALFTFGVLVFAWLVVLGIVARAVFTFVDRSPDGPNQPFVSEILHLAHRALVAPNAAIIALVAITVALSLVDVTSLSLHQFYRQRLARTFAVRRHGKRAAQYPADETMWLDTYGKAHPGGPRFVFAASAAISDGDIRPPHGLNAVSFVMTPEFIGGPALGWLNTTQLRQAAPPRIERDLTVDTAVAVSGSAIASAMGRHGTGIQTVVAALSGARLGTWLPNPRFVRNTRRHADSPWFPKALPTSRGITYLYREVFGVRRANAPLVQVTDGGHYENLGLVEALRRRCRLIYCIDSGLDTPLLSGLADAIRLAKFELGVDITLDETGEYNTNNLVPGSGSQFPDAHEFHDLNRRITAGTIIRGKIIYPRAAGLPDESKTGWLIVAKAVLWRELPHWVLTHAAQDDGANFPHDTTSDQWFTEGRFAAYTELGRRITANAIRVPAGEDADSAQEGDESVA